MTEQLPPANDKLLLEVEEATKLLSIGRSKLYTYILSGELPSVKIGRRRLIPQEALPEFISRLRQTSEGGG